MHQLHIGVILFDLGGVLIELAGVEKMLEWSEGVVSTDELWRRWLLKKRLRPRTPNEYPAAPPPTVVGQAAG